MIEEHDSDRQVQIGEYVLGLLEGAERAEIQALIERDRSAAAMALAWENDFLALADRIPTQAPSAVVWLRIQSVLGLTAAARSTPAQATPVRSAPAHSTAAPAPVDAAPVRRPAESDAGWRGVWDNVMAWRWLTAGLAVAALVLAIMPTVTPQAPAATHMAVLQAPGETAKPGWVVTVQPNGDVVLDSLLHVAATPGRSVELWTLAPNEKRPRSLGLVAAGKSIRLPASAVGPVHNNQLFEMTLEPEGGSPTGGPTGAILFIGRVVSSAAATVVLPGAR
ncbi:MAG: anti-sigma factor [Burkholderiaceae bacterium]|nr:anti-sigma factor [Burkholderiaceae bacterium]